MIEAREPVERNASEHRVRIATPLRVGLQGSKRRIGEKALWNQKEGKILPCVYMSSNGPGITSSTSENRAEKSFVETVGKGASTGERVKMGEKAEEE